MQPNTTPRLSMLRLDKRGVGQTTKRSIGTVGTWSRAIVGLGLLSLAVADRGSWALDWYDAVLGLIAFPAVTVGAGLAARRVAGRPVRFTGPVAIAVNTMVIVALATNEYTATAAALFYGTTLLVAAWRAQSGCEATVLSNWILRRDDQIGCPTFTPIDGAEARLTARRSRSQSAPADERRAGSAVDPGLVNLATCYGIGVAAAVAITLVAQLT